MRYLKIEKNTTSKEEMAQGTYNGTLEMLEILLCRSSILHNYQDQIRLYKIVSDWHKFDGEMFVMNEEDYTWIKNALLAVNYTNQLPNGQTVPIMCGKILSIFDNLPNREPKQES